MKRTKTSMPDIDAQYERMKPLLYMMAKKYSGAFKLDFDEALGEANMLFVRAYRRYDAGNKAKFSSFLYAVVNNGLITFGQKNSKHNQGRVSSQEADSDVVFDVPDEKSVQQFKMVDFWNSLYADEKLLVDLVLMQFASTLKQLRDLAEKRLDFSTERFDEAVYGIKQVLGDCHVAL